MYTEHTGVVCIYIVKWLDSLLYMGILSLESMVY